MDRLEIVAVTRESLESAYDRGHPDFEDDLVVACAVAHGLDAIVTRDPRGFAGASIAVLTPTELLAQLAVGPE